MPETDRNLNYRCGWAQLYSVREARTAIEDQQAASALLQDQHLPLARMVMRSHITVWLKHNHKPLNGIGRTVVQQQVSALTRFCRSLSRQLRNLVMINDPDVAYF